MKYFEVRDDGTHIPVVCFHTIDNRVARRAGFSQTTTMLMNLNTRQCEYDFMQWTRTLRIAHQYICKHWNELQDLQVIDVQWILGETKVPKEPEAT